MPIFPSFREAEAGFRDRFGYNEFETSLSYIRLRLRTAERNGEKKEKQPLPPHVKILGRKV